MSPSLAKELGAIPFFRHASIENIVAHAPMGALHNADYALARLSFSQDLKQVWSRGPYDFIYVNSILPAQLMALGLWYQSLRIEDAPIVVAEFGAPSGTGMADRAMRGSLHWRRMTPHYAEAAELFHNHSDRLLLFTFDPKASADYESLLGIPVATMPTVHEATEPVRLRARSEGRVTISFLGHQRPEKGYQLVPDIVRRLKADSSPVQILVHNGDPADDSISRELREMAKDHRELIFEHRPAGGSYWQNLLERSDLVVLPYERARYHAAYSAVAVEAVSGGIPMVVPAETTIEALAQTFNTGIAAFASWDAKSITEAIERAVTNFEDLAERSFSGAEEWRNANGAKHFVDRLFELRPLEHRDRRQGRESVWDRTLNLALDVFFAVTRNAMAAARAVLLAYRRLAN